MSIVAEKADCEKIAGLLKVNEEEVENYLGNLVRGSVETTLNAMLEAEADALTQARRYERSPDRVDTRADHYDRHLQNRYEVLILRFVADNQPVSCGRIINALEPECGCTDCISYWINKLLQNNKLQISRDILPKNLLS
jgi:hypothetical protein